MGKHFIQRQQRVVKVTGDERVERTQWFCEYCSKNWDTDEAAETAALENCPDHRSDQKPN